MGSGVTEVLSCFLDWVQTGFTSGSWVKLSSSGVGEEVRLMSELVLNEGVGILGWYLVVTGLDIAGKLVSVVTVETLEVLKALGSIRLLCSGVLVVVSFEGLLPRLETGAWLVTEGK